MLNSQLQEMENNESNKKKRRRETWKKDFDFVVSLIGMTIGLGNAWRFPYLCYKNGGGIFLVPYVIFVLLVVWPIAVLETSIGQFSGKSAVLGWGIVPLMKGIGMFGVMLQFYSNISYPIILTWSLRWLLVSFSSVLPWTGCNNTWNTKECVPIAREDDGSRQLFATEMNHSKNLNQSDLRDSSSEEFWNFQVLKITPDLEHQGSVNWELLGCLAIIWFLTYFSVWKGISWTSKIVYVTATLPLVMIIVVIVRGVTMPGAQEGIKFYLKPNVTKLCEIEVWYDAASQVIFTTATGSGALATISKYNKFKHNFLRDSAILFGVNMFASFLAGLAIFSILGYLAEVKNTPIAGVVASGPGLVFVAYPTALSFLPLPQLWSVIFFITLILLGFDSLVMNIMKLGREKVVAVMCFVMFLTGIPMVTQGGMYVFHIFDQYAVAGRCMFFVIFWECLAIGWMYGADRMCSDIEYMLGYRIPRIWFKICWKFVTPVVTLLIMAYSLVRYAPLKYGRTYEYPVWANVIGWILALSSMAWIPGVAIYQLWRARENSFAQKFKSSIAPPVEWEEIKERRKPGEDEEECRLTQSKGKSSRM